jgi:hypothetical protein
MLNRIATPLLACFLLAARPALAAEKVALQAASGRFLRAGDDGTLRATSVLVGDRETFELESRGKDEIVLTAASGRAVVLDARDRTLRLGLPALASGQEQTFQLVSAGAARFALRPHGTNALVVFDPSDKRPAGAPMTPVGPLPRETVEIFRVRPLPALLENTLSNIVSALAEQELAGKQYDQTRTEHTKKQIELPAPTLKDPKRKTKVQVLAMTEEYRLQAKLDGMPEIRIPAMLYLAAYTDGGPGVVLVAVDAKLPVSGHVQAKIHDVGSVGTSYRAAIALSAVAAVEVRRSGGDVTLGPCTVTDLHVSFARLDLSNDLLEAAHRPIRNFINRELHRNEERLRQSANQSLQKAISSREVKIPLLGYLGVL